jgi:dolichyl-phosphate beta-glucosyltransferase
MPLDGQRPAFSLVVPAFDEAKRLPAFLASARSWLASRFPEAFEILVVDDGSRDATASIAAAQPDVRVLALATNRGKGAAVRAGMLAASGSLRLFADADGATPIAEADRLLTAISAGADIAVGSRAAGRGERNWWRSDRDVTSRRGVQWDVRLHRHLCGRVFSRLVYVATNVRVRDTQCGFKLFTAGAADAVFSHCTCDGWAFDVEVLARAHAAGLTIHEVAVSWHETPGSKVRVLSDSPRMLWDVLAMRRRLRPARAVTARPRDAAPASISSQA